MLFAMMLIASTFAQDCPTDQDLWPCAMGIVPAQTTDVMGFNHWGAWWSYPGHDSWSHVTNTVDPESRSWRVLDGEGGEWGCGIDNHFYSLQCWGNGDTEGRITETPTGWGYRDVDVARTNFGCANTRAGEIECWGHDAYGKTTAPYDSGYIDMATGDSTACAIASDGSLVCWGNDGRGHITHCDGLPGPYKALDVGLRSVVLVTDAGEVEICGDPTWTDFASWVSNAPTTADVVDVQVNETGTPVFLAHHSDGEVTLWQASGGTISDALEHAPDAPSSMTARTFRTDTRFVFTPKITSANVCGVVSSSPSASFTWLDGICWGQINGSAGVPAVIADCNE